MLSEDTGFSWLIYGVTGVLAISVYAFYWFAYRPQAPQVKKPLPLTRKAAFELYLKGEAQLMRDWEEVFDPKGFALDMEIARCFQEVENFKEYPYYLGMQNVVRSQQDHCVALLEERKNYYGTNQPETLQLGIGSGSFDA